MKKSMSLQKPGSSIKVASKPVYVRNAASDSNRTRSLILPLLLTGAGLVATYFYLKGRKTVMTVEENLESEPAMDLTIITIDEIDPVLQARLDAEAAFSGLVDGI